MTHGVDEYAVLNDVSAEHPEKLREMIDLMFGEFAKYQVLPLDPSVATRLVSPRPNLAAGRKVPSFLRSVSQADRYHPGRCEAQNGIGRNLPGQPRQRLTDHRCAKAHTGQNAEN
ncbi:hypothetical protein [Pseudaminobacter soli (ex Li et al. 2025)]|uniref:hypothetical protein n=1 Tax=Pseudaminobacter soli (ex Li et al. 2025) TaxID=1295366 RepID=UPI002475C6AE|nr:hypothetical protein [Mesorhizobium soli]